MAELVGTTSDPFSLNSTSSTKEKAAAQSQLNAAKNEWNAWLAANQDTTPYRAAAEGKLSEILQKYPYVTTYTNTGMLVQDRLAIKTDGSLTIPNNSVDPKIGNIQAPNVDDAYPTVAGNVAEAKPNITGGNPSDPNRLKSTGGPPDQYSMASDAPSLSGNATSPDATTSGNVTGGNNTVVGRSGPPDQYQATANTTPVTQNGDAASSSGRTGPPSEYDTNSANGRTGPPSEYDTSNSNTTSDDSGSNGAGSGTDESGTGRREPSGPVTVGQQGRRGPPDEYEAAGSGGTPPNKVMILRPNKLHEYVNWTYQVGWYMLDLATYNSFTSSGTDSAALRKYPIMRSGGFAKTGAGLKYDLGLNSLRVESVIASSNMSPNASIYRIEMQVVEPYGVSLIADLKRMADSLPNGPHDHFQIPYLLDIRFLGYDDTGKMIPSIPQTGPKLIPCQIVNINFNITSAGTVYNISLVPYSQQGINKFYGVLREDARLYGKKFEDILRGADGLAAKLNKASEADVKDGKAEIPDTYDFEIVSFDKNRTANDGKLAQSECTFDIKGGGSVTPIAARKMGNDKVDPTEAYFQLKAGSNIKDLVRDIAITTRYFQGKITDGAADKTNPMELIKVVPVVTDLTKFDRKRGVYAKKIIYKVMPYYVYGKNNPKTGQAPVQLRGHSKEYNWLFTGKNDDVLDIDLNFNLMYFKVFEKKATERALLESGAQVPTEPQYATSSGQDTSSGMVYKQTTGSTTTAAARGPKPDAVAEYFDQELNSPDLADLVKLDMSIIGDPDFIAQDRSVRPKGTDVDAANNGYVDGDVNKGISIDVDGVYVKLNFRTPRDYDDNSGLMALTQEQVMIGGMYQLIRVESEFEGGKFTQKLNMVRVFDQIENKIDKQAKTTDESGTGRRETTTPKAPATVAPGAGRSGFNTGGSPVTAPPAGAGRSGFSTMPPSYPGDAAYGDDAMAPVDTNDKAIRDYYLGR